MDEIPKKLFFSLFSGEIYEVAENEISFLDPYQIPLKQRPNKNCKKCHDRLYIGYNIITKHYDICKKCGHKFIDMEQMMTKNK